MPEIKRERTRPTDSDNNFAERAAAALRAMAEAIVLEPVAVSVSSTQSEGGTLLLTLRVAEADVGLVIGSKGNIIRAMRAVLIAGAARRGRRILVEVIEPSDRDRERASERARASASASARE
jgi:predicted RNA-binding protein YlqC (UPF0109 family)